MGILNRRILRSLHNWTGLFLSVVLVVLALSGTFLVFKDDYLHASLPEATKTLVYSPDKFGQAIARIEEQTKDAPISYISLAHDRVPLHKIVYKNGTASYADQTGEIIKTWKENGSIEDWIFHLHHYLFLGEFGKLLSGVVGFLAIFMVVAGLIIVWPSLRSFKWRILPRTMRRSDLMSQHRDLGIIFALPIILFTFTGASMVYETPAQVLLSVFTFSGASQFERPSATPGLINWPKALTLAQQQFPRATLRVISGPRNKDAPASVRLKQTEEWHQNGRTFVYINPSTSQVIAVKDALALTRAERGYQMFYPIHSAAVGGRFFDIVSALIGLVLTILALVGSWTFVRRLRR